MSMINATESSELDSGGQSVGKWVCQIIAGEVVLGVAGNVLVCFIILRVRFLHSMTNYLLVNLAVADILTCLQAFLFYLLADPHCTLIKYVPTSSVGRELLCRFLASGFLYWNFSYASAYNLCLVTLERYVAIVHPLQYVRTLTAGRMTLLIALIWGIAFLFSFPVLLTNKPGNDPGKVCVVTREYMVRSKPGLVAIHVLSFLLAYLLPVTLMACAYYKIQVTLKRQAKSLHLQHARLAAYHLVLARQRVISMLTVVLGVLVILWTPAHVESMICKHPSQTDNDSRICTSDSYQYIRAICNFLFYLNSVINPIIYEFKYKKFRLGLREAFCCCAKVAQGKNRVNFEM